MEFCEAILDGFGYDALETISSVKSEIGKGEMRNFIYLLSDALELNKSHSMFSVQIKGFTRILAHTSISVTMTT